MERRCDLHSDSRLPWATALAAWATCGTWTRGLHFVDRRRHGRVGAPDVGDLRPAQRRYGLTATAVDAFAVERRRGWTESTGSPPRDRRGDPWDTLRAAQIAMSRRRPGRGANMRLDVWGRYAAFREGQRPAGGAAHYAVVRGGEVHLLDAIQWADWSPDGRLLVATVDGRLQIRPDPLDPESAEAEVDLAALRPASASPPAEAFHW